MLKTSKGISSMQINAKYKLGYAVLLTDDKKYWTSSSFDKTFMKNFGDILNVKKKISKNKKYNYTRYTNTIKETKRDLKQYPIFKKGMKFDSNYDVIWDSNKINKSKFHLAIIKIM